MEDVLYSEHNVNGVGQGKDDVCLSANATYWHRVDDEEGFNFCLVRNGSADAILFLSIAVIAASILHIRGFSTACILIAGCISEYVVYEFNLGRIGNAYSIWLSVSPDVLSYGIVPPLLLHSALRVEWLQFKKTLGNVIPLVLITFILTGCILAGIHALLYEVLGHEWSSKWMIVIVSALVATDSAEASQVIQSSEAPQFLDDFLKSESLIRSGLSLIIFSQAMRDIKGSNELLDLQTCLNVLVSMVGGCLLGLLCVWISSAAMMVVAGSKFKQMGFLYGISFLVYYVAEYLEISGAVSVITLGLYASATKKFAMNDMGVAKGFDSAFQISGCVLNSLCIFLGGALLTNFTLRAQEIYSVGYTVPLILAIAVYISLFGLRWLSLTVLAGLSQRTHPAGMFSRAVPFITAAGIRGPLAILLLSCVALELNANIHLRKEYGNVLLQSIDIGLVFIALTLTVNLLILRPILNRRGLLNRTKVSKKISSHVKAALNRKMRDTIKSLKTDEEDILRGVDWTALENFANENISLDSRRAQISGSHNLSIWNWCTFGKKKKDESKHDFGKEFDIEQPLLSAHHSALSTEIRRIKAFNSGDREIPFISKSNETNNPYLNADSRVSSSSYLPSQGSPTGWSSPTETHRPSEGELRNWWGTPNRNIDDNQINVAPNVQVHQEDVGLMASKRAQIIWAIKRYIHVKEQKGLISGKGASLLIYACNEALESTTCPLDIWACVNKQLETFDVQAAAWIFHTSRIIIYSSPEFLQTILGPAVKLCTLWIGDFLSKSLLTACEVMITYYNALGFLLRSPLFDTMHHREIVSILKLELEAEMSRVYRNILDRETEAPAHFEAVQTYRAIIAVTLAQLKHISSMFRGGVLSHSQYMKFVSHIEIRKEWLEYIGPKGNNWQSVGTLFFSLPIFKGLDDDVLQTILDNGSLREFGEGDLVWDDSKSLSEYGFCIIIRGLVRSTSESGKDEFYGSGTLLGILPALTNSKVQIPGSNITVAQSSRHDKGVLAFFFPKDVLDEISSRAAEGEHQFQKLLLRLQRQAAMDVHSGLKTVTMNNIEIKYQSYEQNTRENRKEMIALSQMRETHSTDPSEGSEDSSEERELVSRAKRHAKSICSKIAQKLENATCIELNPYEPFIQRSHFVLLAGSVQRQAQNTGKKLGRSISMTKISAPYVVPMINQYDATIRIDAKSFLSGHQGALLMVCDIDVGPGNSQTTDLDDASFANVLLFAEDTSSGREKSVSDMSYED